MKKRPEPSKRTSSGRKQAEGNAHTDSGVRVARELSLRTRQAPYARCYQHETGNHARLAQADPQLCGGIIQARAGCGFPIGEFP